MKFIPKNISRIPGRSIIYFVICAVILVIFYFGAVYPHQRALEAVNAKTAQIANLMEKQKSLSPLYEAMVKKGEHQIRGTLPVPDGKALSRRDLETVSPLFSAIAEESGMQVVSIRPDVLKLTEQSKDMTVTIHLRGAFFDFRKFLVGVGGVPSLKRVETIEITQEEDQKQFYVTVRLAIA